MIDRLILSIPLPSWHQWILYFPLGILLGCLSGWFSGFSKRRWNLPAGYSRKIFHFLIFSLAGVIGAMAGFAAVQVFGAAIGAVVGYAVVRGYESDLFVALARPTDRPYERFYIVMPFLMTALGGMASNLLFGHFALIGYIATGWGDAAGEPAGTRWGKHKYRIPALRGIIVYRSIEGSAAVFLASLLGCAVLLYGYFDCNLVLALSFSFAISLVTVAVEAVSYHSLDNLTIQIAASGICALLFYIA